MKKDLKRKKTPGRDGTNDGLEGAELLRAWVLRHQVYWQTAMRALLEKEWRAQDVILIASPTDSRGATPPTGFLMIPWKWRAKFLESCPNLRPSFVDQPPEGYGTCVATTDSGRMRGSVVARIDGAKRPRKRPAVSIIVPPEPGVSGPATIITS